MTIEDTVYCSMGRVLVQLGTATKNEDKSWRQGSSGRRSRKFPEFPIWITVQNDFSQPELFLFSIWVPSYFECGICTASRQYCTVAQCHSLTEHYWPAVRQVMLLGGGWKALMMRSVGVVVELTLNELTNSNQCGSFKPHPDVNIGWKMKA